MSVGPRVMACLLTMILPAGTMSAQAGRAPNVTRIPLARGLVIGIAEQAVGGERESVTEVADATSAGVRYRWRYRELHTNGDTVLGEADRFVSTADLASAVRIHLIYDPKDGDSKPGYTSWSVSSAVYQELRATGTAQFQMMTGEPPVGAKMLAGLGPSFSGDATVPVRWRGSLTRVGTAPESFPVLINGKRVTVAALHARAEFMGRSERWTPELWVLADSTHPLLLKVVSADPPKAFQVVRVDMLDEKTATRSPGGQLLDTEHALTTACRVEVPGVYFAFNSAALDPASDRAIASVAALLTRHRDWRVVIEGHTDSVGGAAANRVLSERRAAAVRERLVTTHHIEESRLKPAGYGGSKPIEPNATVEGRARNRRVELVRDCVGTR